MPPFPTSRGSPWGGEPPWVIELQLYGVVTSEHADQVLLSRLSHLQVLKISAPGLVAPLAPELGNLSRLRHLDLSRGADIPVLIQEGPIPPEWGRLSQLQYLDLSGNEIEGPIPPELGQLARLQYLNLSETYLGGLFHPNWAGSSG